MAYKDLYKTYKNIYIKPIKAYIKTYIKPIKTYIKHVKTYIKLINTCIEPVQTYIKLIKTNIKPIKTYIKPPLEFLLFLVCKSGLSVHREACYIPPPGGFLNLCLNCCYTDKPMQDKQNI